MLTETPSAQPRPGAARLLCNSVQQPAAPGRAAVTATVLGNKVFRCGVRSRPLPQPGSRRRGGVRVEEGLIQTAWFFPFLEAPHGPAGDHRQV